MNAYATNDGKIIFRKYCSIAEYFADETANQDVKYEDLDGEVIAMTARNARIPRLINTISTPSGFSMRRNPTCRIDSMSIRKTERRAR
jgi:Uma2 family endonuclease